MVPDNWGLSRAVLLAFQTLVLDPGMQLFKLDESAQLQLATTDGSVIDCTLISTKRAFAKALQSKSGNPGEHRGGYLLRLHNFSFCINSVNQWPALLCFV